MADGELSGVLTVPPCRSYGPQSHRGTFGDMERTRAPMSFRRGGGRLIRRSAHRPATERDRTSTDSPPPGAKFLSTSAGASSRLPVEALDRRDDVLLVVPAEIVVEG